MARPAPVQKTLDDTVARPPRRWLRYLLVSVAGAVVVVAALTAIFWSTIARVLVERAASSRGVDLTAKEVSLSLSEAHLKDVDATLPAAPGVRVHADSVDVDLATLTPRRVHLHGVEVDADDPRALVAVLSAGKANKGTAGLPGDAEHVTLKLRKVASSVPVTVDVTADKVTHDAGHTEIKGVRGTLPIVGSPIGPFDVALERDAAGTTVTTSAFPKAHATIAADGRTVSVAVDKIVVPGLPRASKGEPVLASGELTVEVPGGEKTAYTGTLQATLDGFDIPHPPELDGIGLGAQAKLTASLDLSRNGLELKQIKVTDGGLSLKGDATVTLSRFDGNLDGTVACSKLAGTAIAAKMGLEGSGLARALAGEAVSGDVGVHLHVVVDAKDFSIQATPSIVVRCGLGL